MNRDKQIEEMAKAIYNLDHCEGYKDDRGCMYAPTCSVCKYGRENKSKQISELLAKQGYRKASEVALEVIGEVVSKAKAIFCPDCDYDVADIRYNLDWLEAELKKKYTEEGK